MSFTPPAALASSADVSTMLTNYYRGWDTDDFAFTGAKFDCWPNNDPLHR